MAHGSIRGAQTADGTPSRLMLQLVRKEHSFMCDTGATADADTATNVISASARRRRNEQG